MIMFESLPFEVKKIFEIFSKEQDSVRLVGGSVRDLLLGKDVSDFDFATKYLPDEIEEILNAANVKNIPTGKKFGTITAVVNGKNFEITTLRKDNETDGRHCEPEFVDDYKIDAARRDFTINALYLDSAGKIHDYFGGEEDLKNGIVRFIGNASERIEEDYLRILRFFRFSLRYAVSFDDISLQACETQRDGLKQISRERIRQEILKILDHDDHESLNKTIQAIVDSGIFQTLFATKGDLQGFSKSLLNESNTGFLASLRVRIASLFLNEKTDLENFFQEICTTNLEKKFFSFVQNNIALRPEISDIKRFLAFYDKRDVFDLYFFLISKFSGDFVTQNISDNLNFIEKFSLPEFLLSGQDLLDLGFEGELVGNIIKKSKIFWADNDFFSDKQRLLDFVKVSQG